MKQPRTINVENSRRVKFCFEQPTSGDFTIIYIYDGRMWSVDCRVYGRGGEVYYYVEEDDDYSFDAYSWDGVEIIGYLQLPEKK
jgi:hypothetical protein